MSSPHTGPAELRAAADRLAWYAEHAGYITDDDGHTLTLFADASQILALAKEINAIDVEAPRPNIS